MSEFGVAGWGGVEADSRFFGRPGGGGLKVSRQNRVWQWRHRSGKTKNGRVRYRSHPLCDRRQCLLVQTGHRMVQAIMARLMGERRSVCLPS